MIGKTHRAAGLAFMAVGFEVMRQNEMLIPDVNPLLQLAIMYPASQYGSVFPDNDHHWKSVGNKSPVNWVVHKLLHLTMPKHRSWQTHSVLVTGGLLFLLYTLVTLGDALWSSPSNTDWIIMRLLTYGFILGVTSHLCADAINPSGIHLIPGMKIKFVPKTSFFATGGPWETNIIYPLCLIVSAVSVIFTISGLCGYELTDVIRELIKN